MMFVGSNVLRGSRGTKAQRAYGALRRGADQGAGFMNMRHNVLIKILKVLRDNLCNDLVSSFKILCNQLICLFQSHTS